MPEPALVGEGAAPSGIELGAGVVWPWTSFSRGDFSRSRRFAAETSWARAVGTVNISVGCTVAVWAQSHRPCPAREEPGVEVCVQA